MPRKTPGPPCEVCSAPSVAKKLCDKHYRRMAAYGNVDATKRPDDWGKRSVHPLNQTWKWMVRGQSTRDPAWDDFWKFVDDVGDRPQPDAKLRRVDTEKPFGPCNWFWQEKLDYDAHHVATKGKAAAAAMAWRKANPFRAKHHELKKMFGIGMDQYTEMLEKQGGGCAICGGVDQWFALAVDHCHASGKIRGLLCSQCNRALGLFGDDLSKVSAAADYLRSAQG